MEETAAHRVAVIARHLSAAQSKPARHKAQQSTSSEEQQAELQEGTYRACVLGAGMMGPAAALYFLQDRACAGVRVCDMSSERLAACSSALGGPSSRLRLVCADASTQAGATRAARGCSVVVCALPLYAHSRLAAIRGAASVEGVVAVVDMALGTPDDMRAVRSSLLPGTTAFVVAGCGVNPGLVGVQARAVVERFARVDALHVRCGGVPAKPSGPLGYKILFGGSLPIEEPTSPATAPAAGPSATVVRSGAVVPTAIYGDVEREEFPGVGVLEAHAEYFCQGVLSLPQLRGLPLGTQKTYRWPGFAEKARALQRLGLASQDPLPGAGLVRGCIRDIVLRIAVRAGASLPLPHADAELLASLGLDDAETDILQLLPRQELTRASPALLLDAMVKRGGKCALSPGEVDLTLATVVVEGELASAPGKRARVVARMIDRGQPPFTSMARTSGFTAAAVAQLAALGQVRERPFSVVYPEEIIFGAMREQLFAALANSGISWSLEEQVLP